MSDAYEFSDTASDGQKRAFEIFKSGSSLCITGPGGTGKSYLISHIKQFCESKMRPLAITALTGAAGSLIGGQTLHGWAGIGLGKESAPDIIKFLRKRPALARRWKGTQTLIIDEISMMSMELFNKLHLVAQGIRDNTLFFGGIQLVLCGDFAQLEPIGSPKLCFESSIWKKYISENTVYLSEIFRQTDPVFQRILLNLRLGALTKEDKEILNSRLIVDEEDANISVSNGETEVQTIKPTILYPLKKDVNRINTKNLNELIADGAQSKTFNAIDGAINRKTKASVSHRATHTTTLTKCTSAPEHLVLAVGSQVMLTKNRDIDEGLVNGSRGVILEIDGAGDPVVIFDNGQQCTIRPESFEVESGDLMLIRRQIPLILAWALTIHKCQGATLTNVITDLSDIFGYAQAYVTLSRVRSLEGLFIVNINYAKIRCNPKVKKYYQELAERSRLSS